MWLVVIIVRLPSYWWLNLGVRVFSYFIAGRVRLITLLACFFSIGRFPRKLSNISFELVVD